MSRRTSIVKALAEKLKEIDGTGPYTANVWGNVEAKLKFWDEVNDFPSLFVTPGTETREYHPSGFTWGFLNVCLKVYVRSEEDAQEQLEQVLDDCETLINANRVLVYDSIQAYETTEILITSITTDEGLLAPYGVGEINLQVRYPMM